ncbi:hypothetical protein [Chryseobacterium sp. ISL-6]|uniref:hypothetical protein n=1 Tax=Chryseobacterium sp. ISL-6 TaxID=2819143 RepID=UPI001BE81C88|nr:hypothetical protein [Chryseobacterium sp. ISL-6]MBT2622510.1 hypothetical protein [Chryseobacterium sp. ISL-6]
MKSYVIVCSFLSQIFFCQTSNNESCNEKIESYYSSYDKKIGLSIEPNKINIKDTVAFFNNKYNGLVGQFDEKNKLFIVHENARVFPKDNSCVKIIFPTWTIENSFDKKGNLRKKQLVYKYSTYNIDQLIFPLQRNKKPLKIENIGDNLFKLKFEDFINILDKNNINKNTIKNFIEKAVSIYKYVTPYGNYWEFYIKEKDHHLLVLVSDETREIVSKSFDSDPNFPSKWGEYLDKRKEIFQIDSTYNLQEKDIQNIIKNYLKIEDSTNLIFIKSDGLNSGESYQQYVGKTWLIRSHYNNNRIKPILMLLDDHTGKILIDINNYPRSIDGEEQFIKDFNELILRRLKTN